MCPLLNSSIPITTAQEIFRPDISDRDVLELDIKLPFFEETQRLEVEIVNGWVIFEGDIILGRAEDFGKFKSAVREGPAYQWANGIIPYEIETDHPLTARIKNAVEYLSEETNLQVIPRTTEADYVKFIYDTTGCASSVGRTGGMQTITIENCSFGSIVHEICHAAGLWHEQSRDDRDDYVTINWENIEADKDHNFQSYAIRGYDGSDIGPYDYGSLMHYGTHYFSRDGDPTIDVKVPPGTSTTQIGQRTHLSPGDVKGINYMYPARRSLGQFYSTDGRGNIARLRSYNNMNPGWNIIIEGNFNGDDFNDLLFYDRTGGEDGRGLGQFYTTDEGGNITLLNSYDNWNNDWDIILADDFDGDGIDDLLFYDRNGGAGGRGLGHYYSTDGRGNIRLENSHNNWSSGWDIILSANFNGDGIADLFFYDRSGGRSGRGLGQLHATDGYGNLRLLKSYDNMNPGWDIITLGKFDHGVFDDILFYDRTRPNGRGLGQIYASDPTGNGNLTLLKSYDNWNPNWDIILPGKYNEDSIYDLFFYDSRGGRDGRGMGQFYSCNSRGEITPLRTYRNMNAEWKIILSGPVNSDDLFDIFFYL